MKEATRNTTAGDAGVPSPAARVLAATAYSVQRPAQSIDLWLDANEAPEPAAGALDAIRAVDDSCLRRYPDAAPLERAIANTVGLTADQIVVGAGGDDVLDRLCRAMLEPGRTAVVTRPTFSMIPRAARLAGAAVREVPWLGGDFPVDDVIAAARGDDNSSASASEATFNGHPLEREMAAAAVFIVTPNNPTGAEARVEAVSRVASALPSTLVVVDLAYVEFAPSDPTPLLLRHENVVCVRTLSKAFGLAGLRIGFGLGSPTVIDWVRRVSPPFAVSGPAIAAGLAALSPASASERHAWITRVQQERVEIHGLLTRLLGPAPGTSVERSAGNFVWARLGTPTRAAWLFDACAALGIAIRRFSGEFGDSVRITCPGNPRGLARLIGAVRTALAPDAIVLDGTLAPLADQLARQLARGQVIVASGTDAASIGLAVRSAGRSHAWVITPRPDLIAAPKTPPALAPSPNQQEGDRPTLLPIGWSAPADDRQSVLTSCAARVISSATQLVSLLELRP